MRITNILVTGPPGCGKTTLIEKVVRQLCSQPIGFITREIREEGNRVGFSIDTFNGQKEVLAHIQSKSTYRVGRYGVRIDTIDKIAVPSIKAAGAGVLIVIDEIGKMECLSRAFRNAVVETLGSENPMLATITMRGDSFIASLKARKDVLLFKVSQSNRNTLVETVLTALRKILAKIRD
ncbi:MAG: NTPase [Desulforhabdus sp.]|jgi:nucleoside-triphosphatase|nr:NTPase [Desulforhabdus sp.]